MEGPKCASGKRLQNGPARMARMAEGGSSRKGEGNPHTPQRAGEVESQTWRAGLRQDSKMTGERPVLDCVGGPAQRTETWVDLPGLPSTQRPPLLAVHCHHQGVILFSVRGRMHGRRQQAACTQHWHRPGGTREDGAKAERECRARMSSELLARRCSMERHSTPNAQARCAPRSQPGHEQPPVQCSAAHQLPPEPAGGAVFFIFWRLQNLSCPGPGFHGPKVGSVSTRGTTGNIGCARGHGWSRTERWTAEIGPEDWTSGTAHRVFGWTLPIPSTTGLPQFPCCCRRPALHSRERRRLDDAVTAMLETWHMRECEVKICRHGSDVESLSSVSAGVSRIAFRTSSVGGLCVLDVER